MKSNLSCFHQVVQLIPRGFIERISREYREERSRDGDGKAVVPRVFGYFDQTVMLMLGHFLRVFSLNELCDVAAVHRGALGRVRKLAAPARNTFSNANRTRDPEIIRRTYWRLKAHLESLGNGFGKSRPKGKLARFRHRTIAAIDSTTLQLSLRCMDWAKHRRQKAAAKAHVSLSLGNLPPIFVVLGSAREHDSTKAEVLCRGLKPGDIVVADRGYNDFGFFARLLSRGIFFVVREKTSFKYKVLRKRKPGQERILSDEEIRPAGKRTGETYQGPLRRIRAIVEFEKYFVKTMG